MVKEWLYRWGGRSGGSGSKSGKRGNTLSSTGGGDTESVTSSTTAPPGCININTVFKLFDFHPFHFSNNLHHHQSTLPQEPVIPLEGEEAPRNSLEIYDDGTNFMKATTLSSSTNLTKDQTLNIQDMKIKTRSCSRRDENLSTFAESSSSINSPGTKTPTLVARLMGLDLLPETSSPRTSSSLSISSLNHSLPSNHQNCSKNKRRQAIRSSNSAISRSLPETPRTSSSERRSDVDIQRFSLQIIEEHNELTSSSTTCQEFDFSKFLTSKVNGRGNEYKNDENMRRPGEYAKEIVKEFKESIRSRRVVGRDVTNTTLTDHHLQRRDQNVVLLTSKKPSIISNTNYLSQTPCILVATKNKQSKCGTVSSKSKVQEEKRKQPCGPPLLKYPPQTWDLLRNKQGELFVRSAALITCSRAFRHSENNNCKRTPSPLPQRRSLLKKQDMQKQKQWEESHDALPSTKNRTSTESSRNQSHSHKQHLMNINCTTTLGVLTSLQLTDYISRIVMEIEGYIVEKLVHETVLAML